ncbi:Uncharacterised protein [Chryseobacterium gleum]|uniref:MORN repeat variant n=2 Tax=Chryseobacterium gleum TaxID=250 RepID=A0A3S4N3X0_CHRGE|nr:hypothetical protein [Chryseobacterium gleum]EFK33020.1 hypothetical protein HMPREF0204_12088 [Chryseobacterium gleum ATCC 35910]QBJ86437.1 hypothetical protein DDI74_09280 [Chryseobacterium gleum]QQY33850.1 hypothetical protein I6I60_08835 [Chryseobacterium gleum]VEE07870.1 Uncharacterised protein [Chryseobacterium gleum]
MKNYKLILFLLMLSARIFSQNTMNDTLKTNIEEPFDYKKYYDCDFGEGNVLIVIKKGKEFTDLTDLRKSGKGFAIKMEAIYSMEFADGQRYESSVVKSITQDSISITNFFNENAAKLAGQPFKLITYPLSSLKYVRFIDDRMLSLYSKRNIQKNFNMMVKKMDHAKMCPAVIQFRDRNNEMKVCHFYLTSQGYDLLYENNGRVYYMEGKIEWK